MVRTTRTLVFTLLLASCGGSPAFSEGGGAETASNGAAPSGGAAAPLDTSDLAPRERAALSRLLDETYAPCTDQAVTLAVCLNEKRPCRACNPAARFLADRVKAGDGRAETQRAYGLRFGSDVRKVDIADSPTKGPADAPVTIMVWSDFECPACRRLVPMIERVASAHAREVRLVHKLYPLTGKHAHAEMAARASIAAKRQGRYWEMEKLLFDNQERLGAETIEGFAKELGLNMDRFRSDMNAPDAARIIERDKADADRSGLTGTPFILINGREFDLALFRPEPDLEAWVTTEIELVGR